MVRIRVQGVRRLVPSILVLLCVLAPATQAAADPGEDLFRTKACTSCHTVGGGRLVGPDLQGIGERRDFAWIVSFVRNAQAMIDAGDPAAVALAAEYPIVMPAQTLSEDELRQILAWIGGGGEYLGPAAVATEVTPELVAQGRELFEGNTRLANGGPACSSCHHVNYADVIGGGALAVELTQAVDRIGGTGVQAVLGAPPFPVMERAYATRPLTPPEVNALVAFLQEANSHRGTQPADYIPKLFLAGAVGAALLYGLYGLLWSQRRRGSVNSAIYDRQITSVDL